MANPTTNPTPKDLAIALSGTIGATVHVEPGCPNLTDLCIRHWAALDVDTGHPEILAFPLELTPPRNALPVSDELLHDLAAVLCDFGGPPALTRLLEATADAAAYDPTTVRVANLLIVRALDAHLDDSLRGLQDLVHAADLGPLYHELAMTAERATLTYPGMVRNLS